MLLNSVGSSSEQTPPKVTNNKLINHHHNHRTTATTTAGSFFRCQPILERDIIIESPPKEEGERGDVVVVDMENNFFPKIFTAEITGTSAAAALPAGITTTLERVETVSISNLHLL